MGKDYIPCKVNGFNLEDVYKNIFKHPYQISQASNIKFFNRVPQLREIEEIEMGNNGTNEIILRLTNGGFCILEGINYNMLIA